VFYNIDNTRIFLMVQIINYPSHAFVQLTVKPQCSSDKPTI